MKAVVPSLDRLATCRVLVVVRVLWLRRLLCRGCPVLVVPRVL